MELFSHLVCDPSLLIAVCKLDDDTVSGFLPGACAAGDRYPAFCRIDGYSSVFIESKTDLLIRCSRVCHTVADKDIAGNCSQVSCNVL